MWAPVAAAGGVADGRTAAAAFMPRASAVQVSTAFLRCEEAEVRDAHRAALAEADDACTVVTDVISGRPCRYIRNQLIDDLVASGLKPLPVPAQQSLTQRLGDTGDREWTARTSGQSAALARETKAGRADRAARRRDDPAAARLHLTRSRPRELMPGGSQFSSCRRHFPQAARARSRRRIRTFRRQPHPVAGSARQVVDLVRSRSLRASLGETHWRRLRDCRDDNS